MPTDKLITPSPSETSVSSRTSIEEIVSASALLMTVGTTCYCGLRTPFAEYPEALGLYACAKTATALSVLGFLYSVRHFARSPNGPGGDSRSRAP